MNRWTPLALAYAFSAIAIHVPAPAAADTCQPCADVLAQEMRWLAAITAGDVATVESILGPAFKHINSDGRLIDRAEEIASTQPLPFTMNPSEQLVDIAGNTAVVHGVNTLMQGGQVIGVERFTDVFELRNGQWMALSAQETAT
ncbi:hypothetical protein MycrhN_1331 [Mycolicibacterium rhodesiae NBB3]|jgi:hypothetical protein|uniref:DUF4440 domain-containing protein n=1 Tax=Mycolicibacterium rhodesiae (strain NBB3) TaxID=710685 RepID=G8RY60_MYCRN|nr:nuclear transport factor 2 family protein [Mycolicibacterium rhodesiae]AEV71951.1 hypothetical protein MycrhN_1331 [Mycolicibacterium rhodesiae NBB3]